MALLRELREAEVKKAELGPPTLPGGDWQVSPKQKQGTVNTQPKCQGVSMRDR